MLILLGVILSRSYALQRVELYSETETYRIIVSNREINRLIFPFKIKSITSASPNIDLKFQGNCINLTITGKDRAELVVYTMKGKSYLISAIPADVESETIIFSEPRKFHKLRFREEYLKSIKDLIVAGYREEVLPGYEVKEQYKKIKDGFYLVRVYKSSQGLILEEYVFMNTSDREIELSEDDFLTSTVRAVSIDKRHLKPKETTRIFMVR